MRSLLCTLGLVVGTILGCGSDLGSAIPTYDGYDAQLEAYKGQNINDVVLKLGSPTKTTELAGGSKAYIWERRSKLRTAKVTRTGRDPQTGREVQIEEGGERVPIDCVTELHADVEGVIHGFRSSGLACIGTHPGDVEEAG